MAGRPQFQEGSLMVRGGWWGLRYRDYGDNGKKKFHRIALATDHPDIRPHEASKAQQRFVEQLAKARTEINQGHISATGNAQITLGEFIENSYFTRCEWRMKLPAGTEGHMEPTTYDGYKDIFNVHVKNSPSAKIRLRDFTPTHGRRFMESISQELSHKTHLRIRAFLSGVFTWATADDAYTGNNPMETVKALGWTKKSQAPSLAHLPKNERIRKEKIRASNEHAYKLEEVAEMMEKLPEPGRTVCATAAFSGLTRSELRGLKWTDIGESSTGEYDGSVIKVQRKVVGKHIGAPKTEAREAEIPLIKPLEKMLLSYKKEYPEAGDGWIFRGNKLFKPLDLDNLSRREIPDHINGAWYGWHAFRRGLGSRLNELGVDAKTIQTILRHANVNTTQAHYILPDRKHIESAMHKLEGVAKRKYGIKW
jgi:integrase